MVFGVCRHLWQIFVVIMLWEVQEGIWGSGGGWQETTLSCRCFLFAGIRQLQLILLKVALLMGVEVHVGVEFRRLLEPPEKQRPPHRMDTPPSLPRVP